MCIVCVRFVCSTYTNCLIFPQRYQIDSINLNRVMRFALHLANSSSFVLRIFAISKYQAFDLNMLWQAHGVYSWLLMRFTFSRHLSPMRESIVISWNKNIIETRSFRKKLAHNSYAISPNAVFTDAFVPALSDAIRFKLPANYQCI